MAILDPLARLEARLDPFSRISALQGLGRAPSAFPPLSPEEEESLLGSITGSILGGAAYLGGILDKTFGGRAVRGLLGGRPRELLSVIPGSDVIGLTDERESVSGKELLQGAGVLGADSGIGGTLAGVGAEILLDPSTYLTLGASAVGKGGKLAKLAGVLPKTRAGRVTETLADVLERAPQATERITGVAAKRGYDLASLMDEPLGGLARARIPFTDVGANLGTGPLGQRVARGLDLLGEKARFSGPGRVAAAMFHAPARDALTKEGQIIGEQTFEAGRRAAGEAAEPFFDYTRKLEEAGLEGEHYATLLRNVAEGVEHNAAFGPEAITQIADDLTARLADQRARGLALGLDWPALQDDYIKRYLPREGVLPAKSTRGFGPKKVFQTAHQGLERREDILRNLRGGTEDINRLTRDPLVSGPNAQMNELQAAAHIRENYLGLTPDDVARRQNIDRTLAEGVPDETLAASMRAESAAIRAKEVQAEGLANWLRSLDPQYAAKGIGFFSNHPLATALKTMTQSETTIAGVNGLHDLLSQNAVFSHVAPQGMRPLMDVLKEAGLTRNVGGVGELAEGALKTQLDRLKAAGKLPNVADVFPAVNDLGEAATRNESELLRHVYVPDDVARDAARSMRFFSSPDYMQAVVGGFDKVTNAFKALNTTVALAFHTRNRTTGFATQVMTGAFDPRYSQLNPMAWARPSLDARDVLMGRVLKEADKIADFKGLSPEQATEALRREVFSNGLLGPGHSAYQDILGEGELSVRTAGESMDALLGRIPGGKPMKSLAGIAKQAVPRSLEEAQPWNIRGVLSNEDVFAPVRAGRELGDQIESMNRLAPYIALRRQGYAPEVAKAMVDVANVDYTKLSTFEKGVMRRVAPFYSFSRHIIPFVLNNLIEHPGGFQRQLIRTSDALRDTGFVPEYLGGGLAIPLGAEKDGQQRYLTQLDLPHEQLNLVETGPNSLTKTGLNLLGMVNPLIKAPLEVATGKQFFTNRDLRDLDPRLGRMARDLGLVESPKSIPIGVENLLLNSPAARAISTLGQLSDTRKGPIAKGVNLLTGLRVSDVDVERQREISTRNLVRDLLRGRPGIGVYEDVYVRPDEAGSLSERDTQLVRLQRTINRRAQQRKRLEPAR